MYFVLFVYLCGMKSRKSKVEIVTPGGKLTSLSKITGSLRKEYALLREEDTPRMVQMYLGGRSFKDIALELRKEKAAEGVEYELTAAMVQRDVEDNLVQWRASNFGTIEKSVNTALAQMSDIYANLELDYVKSKKADSKAVASMLRTLMGSGMGYAEAMKVIDEMEFAGSPDIQRAKMENITKRLNILGVVTSGAKVGQGGASETQNQLAGSIVNYNFGSMDKEEMRKIVKAMQDSKYTEMVEEQENGSEDTNENKDR